MSQYLLVQPDVYYVRNSDHYTLICPEGERIAFEGLEDFDFFLHPALKNLGMFSQDKWNVSEGHSGCSVTPLCSYPTREDALAAARAVLDGKVLAFIQKCVNEGIEKVGLTPRYAEQG